MASPHNYNLRRRTTSALKSMEGGTENDRATARIMAAPPRTSVRVKIGGGLLAVLAVGGAAFFLLSSNGDGGGDGGGSEAHRRLEAELDEIEASEGAKRELRSKLTHEDPRWTAPRAARQDFAEHFHTLEPSVGHRPARE